MNRPATPPAQARPSGSVRSPPTPEVTRRIEENRLRAKALRDQHDAALRASGAPTIHKTPSGFVATDNVHITTAAGGRKRPHASISAENVPSSIRDASNKGPDDAAIRPARKFTKFVDYNMSAMTDTKGGFLTIEDDPYNDVLGGRQKPGQPQQEEKPKNMTLQEWERLQLIRKLQRQKAGPFEPGLSVLKDEEDRRRCRECGSLEIDWVWEEVFKCCVCNSCKDKHPDKYSLLTKTECREDYLLTDPELRDAELLPHLSRPNPHKSHWHDMMLFLRYQVEEYAFKEKWGSIEKLDAEFARREEDKKRRKETKFKEKLLDLKRKTRTEAFRRQAGGGSKTGPKNFGDAVGNGKHVHEWGRTVENEEGATIKTCVGCGMEVEELEF